MEHLALNSLKHRRYCSRPGFQTSVAHLDSKEATMTEYSKVLEGYFTSAGVAKTLSLPCVPDSIEMWNLTKWGTNTNHLVKSAIGFANQTAGTANTTISTGTADNNVIITAGGFTFFSAGTPTFGAVQAMATTFVTQAASANVTVTGHGYATGDTVWIYGTTAM